MSIRTTIAAVALLAASTLAAFADGTLVVEVTDWNAEKGVLTFNDRTQVSGVTADLGLPENLKAGDVVTIEYEGGEDGIDRIVSITRKD